MNINILYGTHYFGKDLFVLEIDGKSTMVYRASGITGGRKGRIVPFMFLNEENKTFGMKKGDTIKSFLYDGKVVEHNKKLNNYPNLDNILKEIEEKISFEETLKYEEIIDYKQIEKVSEVINQDLKKIMNKRTQVDFKTI